jgi:hypothetical protein
MGSLCEVQRNTGLFALRHFFPVFCYAPYRLQKFNLILKNGIITRSIEP